MLEPDEIFSGSLVFDGDARQVAQHRVVWLYHGVVVNVLSASNSYRARPFTTRGRFSPLVVPFSFHEVPLSVPLPVARHHCQNLVPRSHPIYVCDRDDVGRGNGARRYRFGAMAMGAENRP